VPYVPAAKGGERAVRSLGAAPPRHRPAPVAPLQHVLRPPPPGGVQVDKAPPGQEAMSRECTGRNWEIEKYK